MFSMNTSGEDPLTFPYEDSRDSPVETLSREGFIALSVVLGLIMTFGFLNNFIVLVLFCKFKKLRTPVNLLLLNISVSDMLVCVFGTSLSFASSVRGRWLLGRRGCMWYGFINSCFGIVSLISLVVLSYDRYRTLTVYHKHGPDYRKPLLAVGGSWLYSLIWTVPPLLGWSSYGLEGAGTSCSVSWIQRTAQSHAYIICLFIFCLGIPVLIMVYCYGRLLYAVKQVGKIRKMAARKREYHVLFMVIATVVCYLLCWMPYGIVAMMATFGRPGIISAVASVVPSLLAKSSTVINPLIYILMNKQFYNCFRLLFCCQKVSVQNGHFIMPSKTTFIQLHRRVYSNTVACTAQISTGIHNHECSTPLTEGTNPPQVTT
ncbi:teleost multiple tissue opsin 2b isoform X1 [Triplophysa rosa]|uniref:teleost multiple tissue opsin 2b isoform X1 n=1 Tax=Triplophysa rosa TaxID=992332 RepID=UPI002545D41A|nr:teleost multiple tissue opsin 2b isoform X1 [Triplophysa rosa]